MRTGVKASLLAWLAAQAAGARFSRTKTNTTKFSAENIPCPTLAALFTMGKLPVDANGVISNRALAGGLGAISPSQEAVGLLAFGAANFKAEDVHQVYKQAPNPSKVYYLNLFTMNPDDSCRKGSTTKLGLKCNANPEFQNHGYSTTLRHAMYGGSRESRFKRWFGASGVLTKPWWSREKILTVSGMAKMLSAARKNGDKSGEGSLNSDNNLGFYHPSVKTWHDKQASTQWQAVSAYAMFMAAWGRKRGSTYYLTESDLKSFWLSDQKRSGWSKKSWGFKEIFAIMADMRRTGAGNEWTNIMGNINGNLRNPSEAQLLSAYTGALKNIQFQADYKFRTP